MCITFLKEIQQLHFWTKYVIIYMYIILKDVVTYV